MHRRAVGGDAHLVHEGLEHPFVGLVEVEAFDVAEPELAFLRKGVNAAATS
jgi:hypothetical protein